jgi:FdhD protein
MPSVKLDIPVTPPQMTSASTELLRGVTVRDECGQERQLMIPHERPLTLYVDKQELVTLMTLGVSPERLALGYLLNQQLVRSASEIHSITVDWGVHAAAVKTRHGLPQLRQRTQRRIVTTGCGQGTVFGDMLAQTHAAVLPPATQARVSQATLLALLEVMRQQPSIHRQAGSVHGCALFSGHELLYFVEDVGRHNAIDTLTGWMALQGGSLAQSGDKLLYTTGRLTSEMVMKAALMGLPIVISRNGVTAMGLAMAQRIGMTLFGRAVNRHFFCYSGHDRFDATTPAPQEAV